MAKKRVRIAALADVHCGKDPDASLQPLFTQIAGRADILLICGDLTDHGLPEEAMALVKELGPLKSMPMIAVLGNHDYHAGKQAEVQQVFRQAGVHVLDGDDCEVHGIGFAGVKGFMGGFGRRILEPWGEDLVKELVQEVIAEALKLETALARLKTPQRIGVLHYAPVQGTVEGEPMEIFPFLGCSRLEEPLNRHQVATVFHGHAHHGQPEGKTGTGIPVYNVSLPLLRRASPEQPFRVIEVAGGDGETKKP
jgi:Icc-related predicted phosphoesterase